VFGHTHFGWDTTIDSIRYIQSALSYPYERKMRLGSIAIGKFPRIPFLLWDSGAFCQPEKAYWSDYYHNSPRTPDNTVDIAPWVKRFWNGS